MDEAYKNGHILDRESVLGNILAYRLNSASLLVLLKIIFDWAKSVTFHTMLWTLTKINTLQTTEATEM